jgi:hypothetical protein
MTRPLLLDKDTVLDDLDEVLGYLRQLRRDIVASRELPQHVLRTAVEEGVRLLEHVGR